MSIRAAVIRLVTGRKVNTSSLLMLEKVTDSLSNDYEGRLSKLVGFGAVNVEDVFDVVFLVSSLHIITRHR